MSGAQKPDLIVCIDGGRIGAVLADTKRAYPNVHDKIVVFVPNEDDVARCAHQRGAPAISMYRLSEWCFKKWEELEDLDWRMIVVVQTDADPVALLWVLQHVFGSWDKYHGCYQVVDVKGGAVTVLVERTIPTGPGGIVLYLATERLLDGRAHNLGGHFAKGKRWGE